MRMRIWIEGMLALALVLVLGSCGAREEGGEVWRFAIEETRGSVHDAYARRFAEIIDERTGGEVRVVVYPYGTLGTSSHVTEQLNMGTLQLAMTSPGHLGKLIPEVQAFLLHFVFSEDPAINARALGDPSVREFLDRLYAEKGLAFMTAFSEGWMVWTTQEPVRAPADLAGVRFRVMTSPLLVAAFDAYGAQPTPLPYSEVYSALQLGMVEAQANPIFAIEEMSFYEVTEQLIFPRHAEYYTTLAANPEWLASLSPERRRLVQNTVDQMQVEIVEIVERYNRERLDTIRREKPEMGIVELSLAERELFRARAVEVREQYLEMAGPRGAELLDTIEGALDRARRDAELEGEPAGDQPAGAEI